MRTKMTGQGPVPNLNKDREIREARSCDFGRMIRRMPEAVAIPESAEEISNIVRWAAGDGVRVAIRGAGHCQGGQSLTGRGLVIDTTNLDRMEHLGQGVVRAQGGLRWGEMVDALHGTGQLPRVLADIAGVTVGGTLSAGGSGTTSRRYGMQIGQVERLEVVTGTGERLGCSRTENADLFDAVRGGQGQFGIITEAWIRLRRAGGRIRQYKLHYRDFDRFADDLERILEEDRFDHLRAEIRVHEGEIVLRAGTEYDEDHGGAKALAGLAYDRMAIVWDTAQVGRAEMYPTWGFKRTNYHPWRDWFLPWEALRCVLAQPWLDPDWVPRSQGNWVGIYPIGTGSLDAPLFMRPEGERMFSYSILAVLSEFERASELEEKLQEIDRSLIELGAKAYLSGRVGYGPNEWEEHYGEKLDLGMTWKREFDPKGIFRGEGSPF